MKLIIDEEEITNLIIKLSTVPSMVHTITNHIDDIQVTKSENDEPIEYNSKHIASDISYLLEDYIRLLYRDFYKLLSIAERNNEKQACK